MAMRQPLEGLPGTRHKANSPLFFFSLFLLDIARMVSPWLGPLVLTYLIVEVCLKFAAYDSECFCFSTKSG